MKQPATRQTRADYISRINSVFDYIERNIESSFSLDELASVACFSRFHFSRIFDAMVGETPFVFIKRVRLEKAASRLRSHSGETVTEIALKYGFNDLASFSRNFNDHFGTSPTQWRKKARKNSNDHQMPKISDRYLVTQSTITQHMEQLQYAEVRHLQGHHVAYIRHTGPYKGDENLFNRLFNRLFEWAGQKGLLEHNHPAPLVIYHDEPCVTPEEKLRMSVCLPVHESTTVGGEIGKMNIPGGRFLVTRFCLFPQEMPKAWQWIYGHWFPNNGYQPADRLPFETYPVPPENGKLTVDICVPVQPL